MVKKYTITFGQKGNEIKSVRKFTNKDRAKKWGEDLKDGNNDIKYRVVELKPKKPKRDKKTGRWK